jgi:hypothetical protein
MFEYQFSRERGALEDKDREREFSKKKYPFSTSPREKINQTRKQKKFIE